MKEKLEIPKEVPQEQGQKQKPEIKTEGFHRIAQERQKLRGEFLEEEGKSWNEKKKEEKIERIPLDELILQIKEGAAEDILNVDTGDKKSLRVENLTKLDKQASVFSLKNKEQTEALRADRVDEKKFEEVSNLLQALEKTENDLLAKEYEISTKSVIDSSDKIALEKFAAIGRAVSERRHNIENNPETAPFARMYELRRYQQELASGFAETPSRKSDMNWVREKWEQSRAVLLEGPTGTGKTETIKALTKKLYGKNPEVVRCTERTGPPEIFGKVLLKTGALGSTETFFQPGRYTAAIESGAPVLFDEFNQLPTNTRFALKELYNRKAGDEIIIQEDTGKPHIIKKGFAWAATANIKSDKHKERFELDGAESRVFSMRHIDYLPKHELYDLCLAKLMDEFGGAEISKEEAITTLKNFSDAAEEIQNAYDKEIGQHYGKTSLKGGKPKLSKAVLDPGAALEILSGFQISRVKGLRLKEHIEKGLLDFLGKRDYPDSDRDLVARILVAKEFFAGKEAKDFGIKGFDEQTLAALKGVAKKEKKGEETKEAEKFLTLKELAALDPYGIRKIAHIKAGEEFLNNAPAGKERTKSAENGETVSLEEAKEIMEKNEKGRFFGLDEVKKALGFSPEMIPLIPFPREEIEREEKLGHGLILQIDKDGNGDPLTMERINAILKGKAADGKKLLYNIDWYKNEPFFTKETSTFGWKFFSKEAIQGTKGINYLAQTETLAAYLKDEIFKNQTLPPEYEEALDEFESAKSKIETTMKKDWKMAADMLAGLKISNLTRESFADLFYRMCVVEKNSTKKIHPSEYSWTLSRSSDGRFVYAGAFVGDGAWVSGIGPGHAYGNLGSVFSRTK